MRLTPIALLAGLCALPGLARADSIDGAWCKDNGQRLMISGPSITTPGGTRMTGLYDRHGFTYVVPAGEPGAGTTVEMRLLGETAMQSRAGANGPVEDWRRCGPATS